MAAGDDKREDGSTEGPTLVSAIEEVKEAGVVFGGAGVEVYPRLLVA
jgi:hypothetical protein